MIHGRPTWAEISLPALIHNFHLIRRQVEPQAQVMAVVKADAYGHGATECAHALAAAGAAWFGVALVEEGSRLRGAGIASPIFLLGGFWQGQADEVIAQGLTPAIYSYAAAQELNARAGAAGRTISFHLKVDTGIGRLGIQMNEIAAFARALTACTNLKLEGLYSHFAEADVAESDYTAEQLRRFDEAARILREYGFAPTIQHIAASAAIHAHQPGWKSLVRAGASLYGLKRDVLGPAPTQPEGLYAVRPVMSLHSRIILRKTVPPGSSFGYGRTFVTQRESRIATIPIGYADGLRRALSNQGRVIVRTRQGCHYAPIVGRISMDLTILDVTDMPDAAAGDEVILIGSSEDLHIAAEDVAAQAGTISYEIVTGISARVPRLYQRA